MQPTQKFLQKRLYDFLATKWGLTLCICGGFWVLHAIVQTLQLIVQQGPIATPNCVHCCKHNYADNLWDMSYEERLCLPPVDVVYTWVNGSDPKLLADLKRFQAEYGIVPEVTQEQNGTNITKRDDQSSHNRYRDNEELRYSLRSLWKYAPWVRNVYIVTNGQVPRWLNIDHPRLRVVTHAEIYSNHSHLPTFSSPSIEAHLHRIPGLAEFFLYFNDDVMLGNKVWPDDFYTRSKGQKVYMSWEVPPCSPGCPEAWVSDKYCDLACNVSECGWDGGDCLNVSDTRYHNWASQRHMWNSQRYTHTAARYCSYGCPNNWVGDKVCDRACKNKDCGFDGGDCGLEPIEKEVFGIQLSTHTEHVELPANTKAFWVNLSGVFSDKMLEASHDNPGFVRTAVITQKLHILTVLLYGEKNAEGHAVVPQVEIFLAGLHHGNRTTHTFNVTMPLPVPADVPSNASAAAGGQVTEPHFMRGSAASSSGAASGASGASASGHQREVRAASGDEARQARERAHKRAERQRDANAQRQRGGGGIRPPRATRTRDAPRKPRKPLLASEEEEEEEDDTLVMTPPRRQHDRRILGIPLSGTLGGQAQAQRWLHASMSAQGDSSSVDAEDSPSFSWLAQGPVYRNRFDRWLSAITRHGASSSPLGRAFPGLLPTVVVEGVPVSADDVVMLSDGGAADRALADQIQRQKEKELEQLVMVELGLAVQRVFKRHDDWAKFLGRTPGVMWPWKLDPYELATELASAASGLLVPRASVVSFTGRKLLDTFGDSLRFVNALYNKRFGKDARKVPAHMPHLINVNVMKELQATFPEEFELTSSHRFRHPKDMQFSFSYFYFLIHQTREFDVQKEFKESLDLDGDGELNREEVRYLGMFLTQKGAPSDADVDKLTVELKNATLNNMKATTTFDPRGVSRDFAHLLSAPVPITAFAVQHYEPIRSRLEDAVKKMKKYNHEEMNQDEIEFYMVGDNFTKVAAHLNHVRRKQPKFVCLNDDMGKEAQPDPRLIDALQQFYRSYFPQACPFELPVDEYHTSPYLADVLALRKEQVTSAWRVGVGAAVAVAVLLVLCGVRPATVAQQCCAGRRHGRNLVVV